MHIPVLLDEAIDILDLQPKDIVIDGTFGGGGHSSEMLRRQPSISLVCVDLDEEAHARFNALLSGKATFVPGNFKDADRILKAAGKDHADKVLLDLGTSTFQLLSDTKGFSFNSESPLAMTFSMEGSHTGFNASDIVNNWEESSIADILYYYGEERKARKIAKAIVDARPLKTSGELARTIEQAIGRHGKTHPATKTFQALRIAVNDELRVIEEALDAWWQRLAPGGRIAVITFHSLEDRIVKQWMKQHERVITKKAIAPSKQELSANKRARSAKLRAIQRL